MYRFRRDGVSVIVVPDTRYIKKNGLYPVKVEVVFKRRQKYFPTGKDVSMKEWDSMWMARKLSEKAISIEKTFFHIRNEVNNLIDRGEFSLSLLEIRLGHVRSTVNEAITEKMRTVWEYGRVNTFYRYGIHCVPWKGSQVIPFRWKISLHYGLTDARRFGIRKVCVRQQ